MTARPVDRHRQIDRLRSESFDVLVIGGGATGAGAALDAATRGLRVGLVERSDFAAGTSSRSTKLLHGGVRYLEQAVKRIDLGQYHLVREALAERATLLRIAPHLTRRLAILTPVSRWWEALYYLAGLTLYDILAGRARIGRSRFARRAELARRCPMIRSDDLRGAVEYSDGQFDDARMNIAIIRTAFEHGAAVANRIEVVGVRKHDERISGATVRDRLSNETFDINATVVINATGPYVDHIRRLDYPDAPPLLTVSSGVHIVLDRRFSPDDAGLLIPKTEDGRVLFVLPWHGHTLVGTTDDPAEIAAPPVARDDEVEYLLRHLRDDFGMDVQMSDVTARWSGLRPLVADPDAGGTARISRDHVIQTSASGLLTITGGKWTTYRRMAEDVIDEAVRAGGLAPASSSRTAQTLLAGAAQFDPNETAMLSRDYGIDGDVAAHLNESYGSRARQVLETDCSRLTARLAQAHSYIEAEVVHAAQHEMAVTPTDVLARRTRLAFVDLAAAEAALPRVVALLADELGWDDARCDAMHTAALRELRHAV